MENFFSLPLCGGKLRASSYLLVNGDFLNSMFGWKLYDLIESGDYYPPQY